VVLRSDLPKPLLEEYGTDAMPNEEYDVNGTNVGSNNLHPSTGLISIWNRGTHWVLIVGIGSSNTFYFDVQELSPDGKTATFMGAEGEEPERSLCERATDYANSAALHGVDVLSSVSFDLAKCPIPPSFRAVVNRSDLPDVLKKEYSTTAMPGESFNETDVNISNLPGTGFKLVWTDGRRWIVLLVMGGIAESFGIRDYEVSPDGTTMSDLTPAEVPVGTCRGALNEAKRLAKLPLGRREP
jgi:hypothetical protein